MPITTGQVAEAGDFPSSSSGAGDSGKVNKLNGDGRNPVDFNAFEGVRVYQNAGTSIQPGFTVLPFQVESFDTNTFHDNATNNTRLTVPTGKGGKYIIGANISDDGGTDVAAYIILNGTTIIAMNSAEAFFTPAPNLAVSVISLYELAAGDYVEVFANTNGGSNTSGDAQTAFWMYRLAP